ncbi:MAG TPA: xanthine dehydrogenase family protein subunit M [Candidatus Eremiobacteraceae bacterium]|nr:xanthine dehydrogenase family protein subunit M [Candidatus Eremiobacteraceae bacterium]
MYLRPGTLDEALQTLARTPATILAGGTDLFPAFTAGQLKGTVLDISAISELKGIRTSPGFFHIGARTTWTELLRAPLPRGFDGLRAAAREIGSIQIQNQATVAGNICNASPAADGVAALLSLDAELTLASANATRILSLADFIQGNRKTLRQPDEMLTSIRIPRPWEHAASTFLKLGARRYLVISIVMVAVNLQIDPDRRVRQAAVSVGSCSAKAVRLSALEQALAGATAGPSLPELVDPAHFSPISPIDDIRATAEYRLEAAQTLVRRALLDCASKAA